MLDLKTNQWEQINLKGCPSPRSGHRMVIFRCHGSLISAGYFFSFSFTSLTVFQVLYKHKIIIFGGFYDTLREVRFVDSITHHMNYLF